jgi:hypothetical protein
MFLRQISSFNTRRCLLGAVSILVWVLFLTACEAAVVEETSPRKLANPASIFCKDQGGELIMQIRTNLGEYGVCVFEGNRGCEEWAMYRNRCPVGGVDISPYVTEAARFCVLTGGTYLPTENLSTPEEQGVCVFQNGTQCDVWGYFRGECFADF